MTRLVEMAIPRRSSRTASEFVNERFDGERKQLLDKHINLTIKAQDELHRRALADLCHAIFNSNEFVYVN